MVRLLQLTKALSILVALSAAGCAEDPPSDPVAFAQDDPQPARLESVITTPPLALSEAMDGPNLLSPDPAPRHPGEAVAGGTLRRVRTTPLPDNVNWLVRNLAGVHEISEYVSERVARRHRDSPEKWAPSAAERVTVSADGKVYTVHLRRGVYWHPPFYTVGTPDWLRALPPQELTARDFAFTFEVFKDRRLTHAAPVRSWYHDCERLEVVDDHTFKLIWRRPGLAAEMWTMSLLPIPRFIFSRDAGGNELRSPAANLAHHWYPYPIGTGPYRLTAWDAENLIRLERFADYHGVDPPIRGIEFRAVPEDAAIAALLNDDADLMLMTPELYLDHVVRAGPATPFHDGTVKAQAVPALVYSYISWNARRSPTDDVRVRRALTLGMNRARALDEIHHGLGTVRAGPYSSITPFADPTIEPYPYDPGLAASLLKEAGWEDRDGDGVRENAFGTALTVDVIWYSKEDGQALTLFEEDLRELGVTLDIFIPGEQDTVDPTSFDGAMGRWIHDFEDDPFQVFHSSQDELVVANGSNRGGYANPEVDALIEEIRAERDPASRVELHRRLTRILHREQPYTFLFEHPRIVAWKPRVRGVNFQAMPPHDLTLDWWLEAVD